MTQMLFRFTWSGIKFHIFRLLCYSIIKMPHGKEPNWWSEEIGVDKNLRHPTPFLLVKIMRKWGRKRGRHWKSYNHLARHKHQDRCPTYCRLLHLLQRAEKQPEKSPFCRSERQKMKIKASKSKLGICLWPCRQQPCHLGLQLSSCSSTIIWSMAPRPSPAPPPPSISAPPTLTIEELQAPKAVGSLPYEVQTGAHPTSAWQGLRDLLDLNHSLQISPTETPGKIDSREQTV